MGQAAQRTHKLKTAGKRAAIVLLAAASSSLLADPGASTAAGAGKPRTVHVRALPGGVPSAPTFKPTLSIPVAPLGYTVPGAFYMGQRASLVSLDFVDENRILFTFRVPGLLHREAHDARQASGDDSIRQIRALVLRLPAGTIDTEAVWTVHDHSRYLWMLADGHFLLRDGDTLQQADASLELKPVLHLPAPILWLEMDPEERILVTSSREPEAGASKYGIHANDAPESKPEILLRVVRRENNQVMVVSRVRTLTHLAFTSEGYVEALRSRGINWMLNLNSFSGGSSRVLGQLESTCMPRIDFLTSTQMLTSSCSLNGARRLAGISTAGELEWTDEVQPASVWPEMVRSANGARIAQTTLESTHAISATAPLGPDDIKGQAVRVLEASTGELLLETAASPVYDAGGNVALSPSGRRLAVLSHGALEIFDLPAATGTASPATVQNRQ